MNNSRKVLVTAECESCDCQFRYEVPLLVTEEQKYSYFDYGDRKQVSGTKYSYLGNADQSVATYVYDCPKCGYIQSWMQERALRERRGFVFMLLFIIPIVMYGITSLLDMSNSAYGAVFIFMIICVIAGSLSFAGVWDFLIRPNKDHAPAKSIRKPYYNI